jgi:hypothetical protein
VWSRDGKELFYRTATDVMVAAVTPGPAFRAETPVLLFRDRYARPQGEGHTTYDVLPDGRFIFLEPSDANEPSSSNPAVVMVFNWLQELRAQLAK